MARKYTIIEGYNFPKGSTATWKDQVFIVGKSGDLIPSDHWEFNIPGYSGKIGIMDTDKSIAAKQVHDMLKNKGWVR